MSRRFLLYASLLALLVVLSTSWIVFSGDNSSGEPDKVSEVAPPRQTLEERYPYVISKGSTLAQELSVLGVDFTTVLQIVEASKPYKNLASLRPGTRFQVTYAEETSNVLQSIEFRFSPTDLLRVSRTQESWVAEAPVVPVQTRRVTFAGIVTSSLWQSAVAAEMDPNLVSELAEIFAWQVDFAREVQSGDRWRLSVEQYFVNEEPVGWGKILAADYENSGTMYQAVLFRNGRETMGYFAPDGSSLRRMFLKSPLRYRRISSKFQRARFHPVLKVNRPHLGVDYAAPHGTPVMAVGDGTVMSVGWNGGGGNTIRLRHNSVYSTAYKHLSKFAKGLRPGQKVKQGDVIGYVGSTGLSTGPHLHFEFFKSGAIVDPMSQTFPSADPIPTENMEEFQLQAAVFRSGLPAWDEIEVAKLEAVEEPKNY